MQSVVLNRTNSLKKGEFLFELHPLFIPDQLELMNQDLFPKSVCSKDGRLYGYANYTYVNNKYLENEIKGFVQHLALDLNYSSATIKQYITQSLHAVTSYMNTFHPECNSITDLNFDDLYLDYIEFLYDNGQTIVSNSIHRVNSRMEITDYPCKSHYISGFVTFYKYIYSIRYPDAGKEYNKDIWDVRKLGINYDTAVCRKRFTVNFTNIKQIWFRRIAKEYVFYRLQNRKVASVLDDIKALRLFSDFLEYSHSNITSFEDITRIIMEEYFSFLQSKGFVTTTYNHRISALRTFFTVGNMLDITGMPEKPLIMYSDFRKTIHKLPKYYTENELKQINDHISSLPIQIARMLFVLENCGMRVSDICSTTIQINNKCCLETNNNGDYIFTYYMPKTHKYNTIPVSKLVGAVIEEAIIESRKRYGNDCKYIFSASVDHPISVESFSIHMNNMSAKFNLKKDDGSPLRIKGHTFRGTLATQFANCGIGMDVIRMMLGQEKIGVLKHYVTIHSDTMINYLKPIIDDCDKRIRSIGEEKSLVDFPSEPSLIPLPNGRCSKDVSTGICNHANSCYECRMFMPSIDYLEVYKKQLLDAENNIAVAEMHGYERIKELNTALRDNIQRIINQLERNN